MLSQNCFVIADNLGLPCIPTMKRAKKFIFVPLFNNAGDLNEIDLTAGPFNEAFFTALVNMTDPSERWYPTAEVKNVTDERGDPSFATSDDGDKFFVEENVRSVTAFFYASNAPAQMVKKLNSLNGGSWGVYVVDTEFNLIGKEGSSATKFAPVAVNGDSIYAGLVKAQGKDGVQMIRFMFDISTSETDDELRIIKSDELAYNLSELRALINVTSVITNISVNGFTIKLVTEGGTMLNPILDEGLVVADFISSDSAVTSKVYNETDDSDLAITSVTESPDGVYDVVLTVAQTVSDILVPFCKKDGRDYTALKSNKVTVV